MEYLDIIEEYVQDEKRTVTYRWLSLTLNVSSNKAKQMLYHYYDKERENSSSDKLLATYYISGEVYDKEIKSYVIKATVVREDELEKTKKQFQNIFSVHIYSLQRSYLKDLNVLFGVDYDVIKNDIAMSTKHSSIICPEIKFKARESNIDSPRTSSSPAKLKSNENIKSEDKENQVQNSSSKVISAKNNEKSTIASMFAKQKKQAEGKEMKGGMKNSNAVKSSPVFPSSKNNPLSNFLTKGQHKSPKKESISDEIVDESLSNESTKVSNRIRKNSETSSSTSQCNRDSNFSPSKKMKTEPEEIIRRSPRKHESGNQDQVSDASVSSRISKHSNSKANINKNVQQKNKTRNNKSRGRKNTKESNEESSSKRRRIVQPFDSSSESNSEAEEMEIDENPLPPSLQSNQTSKSVISDDDDELIPPTPPTTSAVSSSGRRKYRKLVNKTYQDEDGFLVTKKEYEMVSDSDEETPLPSMKNENRSPSKGSKINQKSPSKIGQESPSKTDLKSVSKVSKTELKSKPLAPKNKKASPTKTKQSSIMTFFKKK